MINCRLFTQRIYKMNPFVHTVVELKHIMIKYFLAEDDFANESSSIVSLMVVCRATKSAWGPLYTQRCIHNYFEMKKSDRDNIRCVAYGESPEQPFNHRFIQRLIFGIKYYQLRPNILPPGIRHLTFGYHHDRRSYQRFMLPTVLLCVVVGEYATGPDELDKLDKSMFPESLESITFNHGYSYPITKDTLPPGLKRLIFKRNFNKSLCSLPESLTYLKLGDYFNNPLIPGIFPPTLTYLDMGYSFNHPLIPGHFPPSLTNLKLSNCFDHPLEHGIFGIKLQCLDFGNAWNHPLPHEILPCGLVKLKFGKAFNQSLDSVMITNLTYLDLGGFNQPLDKLPGILLENLQHLIYRTNHPICQGILPQTLRILELGSTMRGENVEGDFNQPIHPGTLPKTVTKLRFSNLYDQQLFPGSLPCSLTDLEFGKNYNKPLDPGVLPTSLKKLDFVFSSRFNQPLYPGMLPNSLNILLFGHSFNHPLYKNILPDELTHLRLGMQFAHPIYIGFLPNGLQYIQFSGCYKHEVDEQNIPAGCRVSYSFP